MTRLALTIATGLLLAVAIWHVQANALACRMTFNDSGGRTEPAGHTPEAAGRKAEIKQKKLQAAVTYFLRMLGLPRMRTTVELRD